MGLNCMDPLIRGYFSIVNTTVLHGDPWLVDSTDAEPQIQRNCVYRGLTMSYTWILDYVDGWYP